MPNTWTPMTYSFSSCRVPATASRTMKVRNRLRRSPCWNVGLARIRSSCSRTASRLGPDARVLAEVTGRDRSRLVGHAGESQAWLAPRSLVRAGLLVSHGVIRGPAVYSLRSAGADACFRGNPMRR